IKIWISPEGTRSVSGELLNFKKGGFLLALQTNAIIIPVGIRGTDQVMQAKSLDIYLNQQVEVSLGNAIDTNGYSVKEIRQLMSDVKQQIYNSISSSKSSSDNSSSDNSSGGLPS
ncbi:MAG: 1-acyl-sn-glycerol-3-phosphate acyltransferase, partial [Methylococcales bacterium]|nr:1-acyl-sn-glycerol-3-phosphate acyltransferase [Methylococcales bacterium]